MNRKALAALVRRNAEACETATRSHCECACGGQFHGQRHSTAWVNRMVDTIERAHREAAEAAKREAPQSELAL